MHRLPHCPLYSYNLVPSLQPLLKLHVRWTEADRVNTMYKVALGCLCLPQHSWRFFGHRSTLPGLCPILYATPISSERSLAPQAPSQRDVPTTLTASPNPVTIHPALCNASPST